MFRTILIRHKNQRDKWIETSGFFTDDVICQHPDCNKYVRSKKKYCSDHKGSGNDISKIPDISQKIKEGIKNKVTRDVACTHLKIGYIPELKKFRCRACNLRFDKNPNK